LTAGKKNELSFQFMPVGEAAAHLGISRLRLREAIARGVVPARRDNEGRMRVDLSAAPEDLSGGAAEPDVDPAALLDSLFDEVEELQAQLGTRDDEISRMETLLGRQAEALDRAGEALEASEKNSVRFAELLEGAFALLKAQTELREAGADAADLSKLDAMLARSFGLLDGMADELQTSREDNARLAALLARAMTLAETTDTVSRTEVAGLTQAADKAMALLERACAEGEENRRASQELSGLLTRALDAGTRLERTLEERDAAIREKEGLVEKLLSMSERALGLASDDRAPVRRGLWAWLRGRGSGV